MFQKVDNQKKLKKTSGKKKNTILSKQKKRNSQKETDICDKNKKEVCSYSNCLNEQLKLEYCSMKHCTNKLHHLCQNNIDNVAQFEIYMVMYLGVQNFLKNV